MKKNSRNPARFYTDGKFICVEGGSAFQEAFAHQIVAEAASDTAAHEIAAALNATNNPP